MTLNQIVEALLFASQDPLTAKAMAKIVRDVATREGGAKGLKKTTIKDVETAIAELNDAYDKDGVAFAADERSNGWKLYTRSIYGEYVRELFPEQKPSRLSPPALETLAIIAYRQPLTKAAIEAVRGVAVDGVLHTLIERGLVQIGGRADLPGRPLLYETSPTFLEHFGIKGVDDLPNSAELRQVELPQPPEEAVPIEEQLPLAGVAEGGEGAADETAPEGDVDEAAPEDEVSATGDEAEPAEDEPKSDGEEPADAELEPAT